MDMDHKWPMTKSRVSEGGGGERFPSPQHAETLLPEKQEQLYKGENNQALPLTWLENET